MRAISVNDSIRTPPHLANVTTYFSGDSHDLTAGFIMSSRNLAVAMVVAAAGAVYLPGSQPKDYHSGEEVRVAA